MHAWLFVCSSILCNPMGHSLPGSSVHEIFLVRILRGLPCPSSRALSNPGIKPTFPALQADFGHWSLWESPDLSILPRITLQGTASPEGSVRRSNWDSPGTWGNTSFIPGHLIKCGSFMDIYALPLNSLSNFIGLLYSFVYSSVC